MKRFQLGFGFWLFTLSLAAAGLIIGGFIAFQNAKAQKIQTQTSREVALSCTTDMATQFHIHPTLTITLFGQRQEIQANIGVTTLCMNAIHTHDASGVLHVESPVKKDFTLGDFFAVWKRPFTKEHILDTVLSSGQQVIVTVNGKEVATFDQTIMNDKDQIGIEVR